MEKAQNRQRRKSFTDALREKYAIEEDQFVDNLILDIRMCNRNFEGCAEFDFLRNVVLTNQTISSIGAPEHCLQSICPNVVDLDLSWNYIETWDEILPMFSQLGNLKFVSLGNNPISHAPNNFDYLQEWTTSFMVLDNLVLNGTGVTWEEALLLARLTPSLRELHLGNNGYECIPDTDLSPLNTLHCLHLHENSIHSWSDIWKLRNLPELRSLILAGNPIDDIFYGKNPVENIDMELESVHIAQMLLDEIVSDLFISSNNRERKTFMEKNCDNGVCHFRVPDDLNINDHTYCGENQMGGKRRNKRNISGDSDNPSHDELDGNVSNERGDLDMEFGNCDCRHDDDDKELEVFCKNSSLRFWISLDNCNNYRTSKMLNKNNRRKKRRTGGYKNSENRTKNVDAINRNNNHNDDTRNDCNASRKITQNCPENSTAKSENLPQWKNTTNEQSPMEKSTIDCNEKDYLERKSSINKEILTANSIHETEWKNTENVGECPTEISANKSFHCLRNLCLSNTLLSSWEPLINVRAFPCLSSLKIMGIPLEADMDVDDRRKLYIACLPTITVLNGSEIRDAEREDAERHFLRYFANSPDRPSNMDDLEAIHGKLEPLPDIDLGRGFREWVNLKFLLHGNLMKTANIHIVKPLATLRMFVAHKVVHEYGIRVFRMWHSACGAEHGDEDDECTELFLDSLPMSRFDMMDGDEIHIEQL